MVDFLETKRGHRSGRVQMWKRHQEPLLIVCFWKWQPLGSQLGMLLQPSMGMSLFRFIHIDGFCKPLCVNIPNYFNYANAGRRLRREKKQN